MLNPMPDLVDARPCGERSSALKTHADQRILESLQYLRDVLALEAVVPVAVGDAIEAIAKRVTNGERLSAGASALYTLLVRAIRAGDTDGALSLLQAATPDRMLSGSLVVSPQGRARKDPVVQTLFDAVLGGEHRREYAIRYDVAPPDPASLDRSLDSVASVLALLKEKDSESHAEIHDYVSDLLVVDSNEINAGTSFRAHGVILLRQLGRDRAWTTYLENIVHETAHLHLFMVWTQDSVFRSGAEDRARSPLRTGERPLSGIYHAMFVLARTIRIVRLFAADPRFAADVAAMSTSYNYLKNPASFETKFYETVDLLERADLTPVGRGLLDSCRDMVAAA